MSPRKRRRRGYYVRNIADLAKDDHAIFFVGEINLRYLGDALDLRKFSRRVILTGYRYNHYIRGHPEMRLYGDFIESVLAKPDVVARGQYQDKERLIFSRWINTFYLSLVVEIADEKRQHEVISFYPSNERPVRLSRKLGLVIWQK
jgi:hypothetical protein